MTTGLGPVAALRRPPTLVIGACRLRGLKIKPQTSSTSHTLMSGGGDLHCEDGDSGDNDACLDHRSRYAKNTIIINEQKSFMEAIVSFRHSGM